MTDIGTTPAALCGVIRSSGVDLNRLVTPLSILVALVLFGSAAGAVGGGTEAFRAMFLQGICGPLLSVLVHRHIWTTRDIGLTAAALAVLFAHVRVGTWWSLCASILVAVGWPLIGWSAGG